MVLETSNHDGGLSIQFNSALLVIALGLGIVSLGLSIYWILHKEKKRLYGLLVGGILGTLDKVLMIFLWRDLFIFHPGTLIINDFITLFFDWTMYSTYFLLFKFEKFDANQCIFFVMLSTFLGTLLEQFTLVWNPAFSYPIVFNIFQWTPLLTLIYFACMFTLGLLLVLFFEDRDRLKMLLRNEL